jgi:hypothetical protein
LVERLRQNGHDAKITIYPNAHHAFDMPYGFPIQLPGVSNGANCRPQYESILGPLEVEKNFSRCTSKGATAGRDVDAIQRAAAVLRAELSELRAPR